MDWFDEEHFPSKDEFGSSFEYGEGVYEAIINHFHRKRGGTLREELDKTAQGYAHLYAFTKWNNRFVVDSEDLEWIADVPFDDPSIQVIKGHASKIATILTSHGWYEIDTSYCFSNSDWHDSDAVYVYQRTRTDNGPVMIPGISNVLDGIGADCILSSTALREYVRDRLEGLDREIETDQEIIDAYVGAIETRLDERNWLDIEAHDAPDRLWFESDTLFDHLMDRLGENKTISDSDFQSALRNYIQENIPKVEDETSFNLKEFLDPFYQRIRVRDWFEVEFQGEVTWYRTKEAQRKALAEYITESDYGEVLESPSRFDYETYDLRQTVLEFFRENKWAVSEHDFYEMSFIRQQLWQLEHYADVDEQFEEMEGAKVADGTWQFVTTTDDSEGGDADSEEDVEE